MTLRTKTQDAPKPAMSKRQKLSGAGEAPSGALRKDRRRPFCFHVEIEGQVYSSPAISHHQRYCERLKSIVRSLSSISMFPKSYAHTNMGFRSLSAKHSSKEDQDPPNSTIMSNPRSILSFLANSNKSKQISPVSTSSQSVPDHMRLLVNPNLPRRLEWNSSLSSHLHWRNGLSQPIQTVIIEAETTRNSSEEDSPPWPTTSRHLKTSARPQGHNFSCYSEEMEREDVASFKRPIMGTQKPLSSFRSIPCIES
ncbi:hypothetical protein AAMO2058_000635800 [Amorphochlora amoebiformis]